MHNPIANFFYTKNRQKKLLSFIIKQFDNRELVSPMSLNEMEKVLDEIIIKMKEGIIHTRLVKTIEKIVKKNQGYRLGLNCWPPTIKVESTWNIVQIPLILFYYDFVSRLSEVDSIPYLIQILNSRLYMIEGEPFKIVGPTLESSYTTTEGETYHEKNYNEYWFEGGVEVEYHKYSTKKYFYPLFPFANMASNFLNQFMNQIPANNSRMIYKVLGKFGRRKKKPIRKIVKHEERGESRKIDEPFGFHT